MEARAKKVLDTWFSDLDQSEAYFQRQSRFWFMGGEKVDAQLRAEFSGLLDEAMEGKLDSWAETPKGCLALIVLLDQFALNIHRERRLGYEASERAIPLALRILDKSWDYTLTPAERIFAYIPLEHAESLELQEKCVALFTRLADGAPAELAGFLKGTLDYAGRHLVVVKRFGRFPHRNAALGRESTPEELEFLASPQAPF